MQLIKGSKEQLIYKAVSIITETIKNSSKQKFILGIPGGRSWQGIFKKLRKSDIAWKKVHIFMVDERFVDINDSQSNYKGAKESFIDELITNGKLPKENAHPFIFKSDENAGVNDYIEEFTKTKAKFDLILLGAGEDGHCASLFPNHPSIKDESGFFIKVENAPKYPPKRISASKKLLSGSNTAILLFLGEQKKLAFQNFCDKNIKMEDCPSKVALNAKNCYVLRDIS